MNQYIRMNYQLRENNAQMVNYLQNFLIDNEEVIIINIGTDKCIVDAVGCIVGSILQENNCPLEVYGTVDNPIHALNITNEINRINRRHPNAKIIAIDACLGDAVDIGDIIIRNRAVKPGKGAGKKMSPVGDLSIVGIVGISDTGELVSSMSIRLSFVYNMAKVISNIIMHACELSGVQYRQPIYKEVAPDELYQMNFDDEVANDRTDREYK